MVKKSKMFKANFRIPREEWEIFKLILARHRAYDMETGRLRQATASEQVRDDILVFIDKHQEDIAKLIEEIEQYAPNSPLLKTLKEFRGDEQEENDRKANMSSKKV
jgi:hypothetical protein